MTPIRPEELSALLDGELEALRAAEVRAQIQGDPSLRQEFEALEADDAAWRTAANTTAAWSPPVTLPVLADTQAPTAKDQGWLPALGIAIGVLLASRAVLKLVGSDALAVMLPAASLLLLVALVVRMARPDPHDAT